VTLYDLEIELVKRNVSMSLRREAGKWIAHCGTSIGIVGTGKIGHGRDADIEQAIRAMLERFDGRRVVRVNYRVEGNVILLSDETSAVLDDGDSDASAVEREIRRDAAALAKSLGRRVIVEAANGIELKRLGSDEVAS
jgi:hypothetical protein